MIYILYIVLITGMVLVFVGLLPKPAETVSVFGDKVKEEQGSMITPFLRPFAPLNKAILKLFKAEKRLKDKIDLVKWSVSPSEFYSSKELLAIILPLNLYVVANIRSIWILSAAFLLGFLLPNIVLAARVKRKKYSIVRVLPETVDLLGLCVGAGLDFMAAVRWVINKVKVNPLIEELSVVLREINVGKSRNEALRDMSKRLQIPDVTSFVRTLVQADRMGTPVEEAFRILSEDTRMRRFHRGERQAMKAPLKMLIPLVFFILPVILIIVAGPILIRFTSGELFKGLAR